MELTAKAASFPIGQARPKEITVYRALRDTSAAGLVLVSIVPEASSRFIFVPVFVLWVLFAFISRPRAFKDTFISPDIKSYSVYFWLILYATFYFMGYMHGAEVERLFNHARIGFSLLFFNYYLETDDMKSVKLLTLFALACIVFTSIATLRGLALNPMAARLLATGREELIYAVTGMGIGSFGFAYGLTFVVVAIFGLFRTRLPVKHRIIFTALVALFTYTIFSAAFMMSLLLLFVSVALTLLNIKSNTHLVATFLVMLMLLFALSPVVSSVLNFLGDTVEHPALSMRFHELAIMSRDFSVDGTLNAEGRWGFVTLSIRTFFSNPILGVGGFYGFATSQHGIGGHSAFLDELAKYGIIGAGFLFVALYSNARFVYRRLKNSKQKIAYYCSMTAFFILGFINTLLFVTVVFMAYFVVPGIICSFSNNMHVRSVLNEDTLVR